MQKAVRMIGRKAAGWLTSADRCDFTEQDSMYVTEIQPITDQYTHSNASVAKLWRSKEQRVEAAAIQGDRGSALDGLKFPPES